VKKEDDKPTGGFVALKKVGGPAGEPPPKTDNAASSPFGGGLKKTGGPARDNPAPKKEEANPFEVKLKKREGAVTLTEAAPEEKDGIVSFSLKPANRDKPPPL